MEANRVLTEVETLYEGKRGYAAFVCPKCGREAIVCRLNPRCACGAELELKPSQRKGE
jgi:predicted RNA-binding Zn-ribbon protein involved in translation (DUF1610 family)